MAARRLNRPTAGTVPRAKVLPPEQEGLPRSRLARALDTDSPRLVLVTAPPGAGKTTFLADFARAQPEHAVAWCLIEGQDTEVDELLRSLGWAVTTARGEAPRTVTGVEELLALLEAPDPDTRPLTLIVDDAHLLSGSVAESALTRIIRLSPTGVRMVLAGRAEPRFVSGWPRLNGAVAEITADDLRFRSWEVEALFRDWYQAPLPPEDAAALTRHTEGWAAGLRLFHLATQHKPHTERHRAIASLRGTSYLLRRYLTSNVLAELPADVADFLVLSSALGVLEGSLCDQMLDRAGSIIVLRELAEANMFTLRCDDEGSYYRYHAALQGQLESMLAERFGLEGARGWYRRAAALLDDAGLWPAAHRAYARAEDWRAASQVLLRHDAGCSRRDVVTASMIPELLDDDPWLSLAEARQHRARGMLGEAIAAFDQAERLFDDPRMRQRCRAERRVLAAWMPGAARTSLSEGGCWEALRNAVRHDFGRLTELAADHDEPEWQLVGGLGLAMEGHQLESVAALRGAAQGPDSFVSLATRLFRTGMAVMLKRPPEHDVTALIFSSELAGFAWLARVGRAIAAFGEPTHLLVLRKECDTDHDLWGGLLVTLMLALTTPQEGLDVTEQARELVARARELDAGAIEAWGHGLLTDPGVFTTLVKRVGGTPALTLRCFGEFSLRIDGDEVAWRGLRPRAQATLRLLCLHIGEPVHEEALLAALWPNKPAASGKRNLQVAISTIRGLLEHGHGRGGHTLLRRHGEGYLLDFPVGAEADIVTFQRYARRWRRDATSSHSRRKVALREALAAYRGDLLPDDGPAEWVVAERGRLRAEAADMGVALAELALADGDTAEAARVCQKALRADEFHDAAWRLLAHAYERAGDNAAAARARRDYASALAALE